jgi:hypothetical protein
LFAKWETGDFTLRPGSPAMRIGAGFSEAQKNIGPRMNTNEHE